MPASSPPAASSLGLLAVVAAGVAQGTAAPADLGSPSESRQAEVGFVFQSFHLIEELTAPENTELAALLAGHSARAARDRARTLLAQVGLADGGSFPLPAGSIPVMPDYMLLSGVP